MSFIGKKSLKALFIAGMVVFIFLFAIGGVFAGGKQEKGESVEAAEKSKGIIALSTGFSTIDFLVETNKHLKYMLEDAGYEVLIHDPGFDSTKQLNDWETWISMGVKGIIAWPNNIDAAVPITKKAAAAGVKVVSMAPYWEGIHSQTITPNYETGYIGGKMCAEWMQKTFGGAPVKAAVMRSEDPHFDERGQGYAAGIKENYPQAEVLEFYAFNGRDEIYQKVSSLLVAHPDLKIVMGGTTEIMGAYSALLDAGVAPDDPEGYVQSFDVSNEILSIMDIPNSIWRENLFFHPADWSICCASLILNAIEGGPSIDFVCQHIPLPEDISVAYYGPDIPEGVNTPPIPRLKPCYLDENNKWVNPNDWGFASTHPNEIW